jgi:hypothetical protein
MALAFLLSARQRLRAHLWRTQPMAEEKKHESELDKRRGLTESQQSLKAYHEGEFQSTDPVTGEARNPGGLWQDAEDLEGNIIGEELTPEQLQEQQDEEIARSAEAGTPSARKSAGKSARKGRKSR